MRRHQLRNKSFNWSYRDKCYRASTSCFLLQIFVFYRTVSGVCRTACLFWVCFNVFRSAPWSGIFLWKLSFYLFLFQCLAQKLSAAISTTPWKTFVDINRLYLATRVIGYGRIRRQPKLTQDQLTPQVGNILTWCWSTINFQLGTVIYLWN